MWTVSRGLPAPPPEEGVFEAACKFMWEQARDGVEGLCDCTFVLDDGSRVLGHRVMAAARSSYFASCFRAGMIEAR